MYLLVFKKPSLAQIEKIRHIFSDFDWDSGFAVEELVVDEIINNNLLIQFVSAKEFFEKDDNSNDITISPTNVEAVLTGKGQFYGTLYSLDIEIEKLDSYFAYLGEATENRDQKNEVIYKIEYGKYSNLVPTDIILEKLIN
jgi:hypothetical protein